MQGGGWELFSWSLDRRTRFVTKFNHRRGCKTAWHILPHTVITATLRQSGFSVVISNRDRPYGDEQRNRYGFRGTLLGRHCRTRLTLKCYLPMRMKPETMYKRHAAREGRSGEGDGFQIRTPRSDPNLTDFRPRTAAPPARDNKQKLISQTKHGARSRRLDRTTQPVQTTLRIRRENSLRQGSCSSTRSMKTTASYSLLFLYISPFSVLYF